MRTLDEEIVSLRKSASKSLDYEWQREQYQIAEWLEELKDYQDKNKMVVRVDVENIDSIKDKIEELSKYAESKYSKGIDDLSNILKENYDYLPQIFSQEEFGRYVDEYAEQLKAGAEE